MLSLCEAGSAAQPIQSATDQNSAQIVTFLFKIFDLKNAFIQTSLQEAANEPEIREVTQQALTSFDIADLASRLSQPVSQVLAPQEIKQCVAFIESKNGTAVLRASQEAASPNELPKYLDLLPQQEKHAAMEFFNSNCFKKTIEFMSSKEAKDIAKGYGSEIMCKYAKRTNTDMLNTLRRHGACQDT